MPIYLLALLIGIVGAWLMVPMDAVLGTGALWARPGPDLAQNLTGHLAAQMGHPFLQPLFSPMLAWPHGVNVSMTDSNPLLTLLAELLDVVGGGVMNLMGAWFFACFLLQPVAAVYALRGFTGTADARGRRWEAAVAASVFALCFPALLARYVHVNLMAHFLLLLALGLAARMVRAPSRRWWKAGLLLLATVLVHPYLFVFAAITLFAPVLARWWMAPRGARMRVLLRQGAGWVLAAVLPVAGFMALSGGSGGADIGWGFFSMNLLSPVWPQHSGLFGANLPYLDATGGQYEGFNYLGAGGLLLVVAALVTGWWRGFRFWAPLIAVLAGLTLIALSTQIYAGHALILPLGIRPWDQVFGVVRSSGRAFWVVGYAILLGAIAHLAWRLPRVVLIPLLAIAIGLQIADAMPLWRESHRYYADGQPDTATVPVLPAHFSLLRTVPVCLPPGPVAFVADRMRLAAILHRADVGDMHASRLPRWFNCESGASDALETPLRSDANGGELRVFIGPITSRIREAALGPGAQCRRQDETVLCAEGVTPEGTPVPAGAPLPVVPVPATLAGATLAPVFGTGWTLAPDGTAWSEGPRASLLFRPEITPEGAHEAGAGKLTLHLALDGIANRAGADRVVTVRVGDGEPRTLALKDGAATDITLEAPADRPVWIAFDIYRPLEPAKRGLHDTPTRRVALRLHSLAVTLGGG